LDKIRVVLADDHQQMITMVRQTFGEEFEVLAAAEDGEQAVNAVLMLSPDVLVIDILCRARYRGIYGRDVRWHCEVPG
jgi:DNA-binding NarL/FixJ family response regulator